MEFAAESGKKPHNNCSTLILPALSIGNVGQLAVDLLVTSLRADKIGYLDDPYVLPCVGNDAYGPEPQGDLAVALEVYDDPVHDLSIIQQRSPVMKGMMIKFANNLSSWASIAGKREIVIVSSLDSGKRLRCDMASPQIYYISTANTDGMDENCEKHGWKKLEQFEPSQKGWNYLDSQSLERSGPEDSFCLEDELSDEDYIPSMPFASLFSSCKAKGLKVTCIFCFCSEGDNIPDAFLLAEAVYKLRGIHLRSCHGSGNRSWAIPLSWNTVYGPPPDLSIF